MTNPPMSAADLPPLPQVTIANEDRIAHNRSLIRELVTSLAMVVGWFSAVGTVGALIWVNVTSLPGYTRVAAGGAMDEEELAKQFSINGWFLVIAVIGGVASGFLLLLIRRGSPIVMVVLVGLGGGFATWLMVQCGLAWGPGNPNTALAAAQLGDVVPVRLKPDARGIYFAWSIAALFGSALAMWLLESQENRRQRSGNGTDLPRYSG